ncbi:MAG: methyltransferase domain-containing protein, partial [Thermodesulfobacteriota bacterium]
ITAAAVIEHLPDPDSFLSECHRVLKPGGGLFLTCPAPFFEWAATKIGYLKYAGHVARYGLSDLTRLSEAAGFRVVLAKKFMATPVELPGHLMLESLYTTTGLSFLMLNQVLGAIKEKESK